MLLVNKMDFLENTEVRKPTSRGGKKYCAPKGDDGMNGGAVEDLPYRR